MPVLPYPPTPEPGQDLDATAELLLQREITDWFIASDPVSIILVPRADSPGPGGSVVPEDGLPRGEQVFKLIGMSSTNRPFPSGVDSPASGVNRRYEYTLLGSWDAIVEENDYWVDENGQKYVVQSLQPYNGYEVRALVDGHGRRPGG